MDFQPRIDNNCLNQPRAGPFLAPAPRVATAGDGEEGGFERNERQRSIPFVESRARAWRIYDPCHCLFRNSLALSLSLSSSPLEASSLHDYSRYIHSRYSELFILLQLYYLRLERERERLSYSANRDLPLFAAIIPLVGVVFASKNVMQTRSTRLGSKGTTLDCNCVVHRDDYSDN